MPGTANPEHPALKVMESLGLDPDDLEKLDAWVAGEPERSLEVDVVIDWIRQRRARDESAAVDKALAAEHEEATRATADRIEHLGGIENARAATADFDRRGLGAEHRAERAELEDLAGRWDLDLDDRAECERVLDELAARVYLDAEGGPGVARAGFDLDVLCAHMAVRHPDGPARRLTGAMASLRDERDRLRAEVDRLRNELDRERDVDDKILEVRRAGELAARRACEVLGSLLDPIMLITNDLRPGKAGIGAAREALEDLEHEKLRSLALALAAATEACEALDSHHLRSAGRRAFGGQIRHAMHALLDDPATRMEGTELDEILRELEHGYTEPLRERRPA